MDESVEVAGAGLIRFGSASLDAVLLDDKRLGFLFRSVPEIPESFGFVGQECANFFMNTLAAALAVAGHENIPVVNDKLFLDFKSFRELVRMMIYPNDSKHPIGAAIDEFRLSLQDAIEIGLNGMFLEVLLQAKSKANSETEQSHLPLFESSKSTNGRQQYVYFMKAGDFVKIGFACNVNQRLQDLQIGSPHPIELMGKIKGGAETEKKLHRKFSHLRINGEWFKHEGGLKDYLKRFDKPKIH